MVSPNVAHEYFPLGEVPQKKSEIGVDGGQRFCYSCSHIRKRAFTFPDERVSHKEALFALRKIKNRICKRFPQTPSKVLIRWFWQCLSFIGTLLKYLIDVQLKSFSRLDIVKIKKGRTMPGRKKSSKRLSKENKTASVAETDIQLVFGYWVYACRPAHRRRPVLDEKRRISIGAAIHDYGVEQCLNAIEGCTKSDFHMGRNKANKRYDDIELILRDSQHIEQFLELYERSGGGKEPW